MGRREVRGVQLAKLLKAAAARPMTGADRERQIVSFAYGNLKLEMDRVTKSQLADALRQVALKG